MGSEQNSNESYIDKIDKTTEKLHSFNQGVNQFSNDTHAIRTHADQIRDNISLWANAKQYAESQGGSGFDRVMNFSKYCDDNDPNKKYE